MADHEVIDHLRQRVLIEPVLAGQKLLDQIRNTSPPAGSLAVWWLGQSGFLLKTQAGVALIDPYLSESLTRKYEQTTRPHIRMTRAPLAGEDLDFVDLVLASHKHSDHLDPETLKSVMRSSPRAKLVLSSALVDHALSLGASADRIVGIDAGSTYELCGFRVRALPSAHEGLDTDEAGRHLYLGFSIECAGLRVYHSGDTLVYPGLAQELVGHDALFLPINGRDPSRGVPGNMTAAEAIDLAVAAKPRFVIPHHYDMFTFNTVSIALFEEESRRLPSSVRAMVLGCGERWVLSRADVDC